jgi:iron(III) transport system permease protein
MGSTGRGLKLLAVTLGLLLLGLCLYPFLVLNWKVLNPLPLGEWSVHYFEKALASKGTLLAIKNTAIVSLSCGVLSIILALPLSWLLTRCRVPGQKVWRSLFCLPYAIPPYIGAMAWIYLANPQSGILNQWFGIGAINIYSMGGLIWVMSSFLYTFVLLSLLHAFDRLNPSFEEAARVSGAGSWRVFWDITFPIIRPSLVSGFLFVVLASAASFGVPAMIGDPSGIYLMTTRIYTYQKMGSLSGLYSSGALSSVLLFLAIGLLWVIKLIQSKDYKTLEGKATYQSQLDLKHWTWPSLIGLSVLFSILFLLPLVGIIITALSKNQGVLAWENFGLQNFYKIFFEVEETGRALSNSLKLAMAAATAACFLGFVMAYIITTKERFKRFGKGLEVVLTLPFSTPGTVVALAFILAFGQQLFGLSFSLYNTLALIVLAYMAKYINFSYRTARDGMAQVDMSLEEAARVSGANWWQTIRDIWFPLMKTVLFSSWFLVFMPCFSELTMTILLSGPGLETVGTLIFQLQEYADSSGGGAAVLALMTITAVVMINYLVKITSKGKFGL